MEFFYFDKNLNNLISNELKNTNYGRILILQKFEELILNLNPNKINGSDPINCYVTFSNRDDLSVIELGDRNTQPIVSKYHLETLNVSFNDIIKLKNEKCQF